MNFGRPPSSRKFPIVDACLHGPLNTPFTSAIIVAAGSGSRFGAERPKQFVELLGKPLIIHTLERFDACQSVDEIVLVLSESAVTEFEASELRPQIGKLKTITAGGATRAESVRNGLAAVSRESALVAVHDGARPMVGVDEIAAVIAKAAETGAACLVAEVTDTIKTISGAEISGTLDRTKLRRALTPQVFGIEILRRAFTMAEELEPATDECYLVEKLGYPISFVEGSSTNIKVTRREDLLMAEILLDRRYA